MRQPATVPMHALRLWSMQPKGRQSRRSRTVRCDNHRRDPELALGFRDHR